MPKDSGSDSEARRTPVSNRPVDCQKIARSLASRCFALFWTPPTTGAERGKMRYPLVKLGLVLTALTLYSQLHDSLSAQETYEFRPQTVALKGQLLNCQARRGGIRITFKGTDLMPKARG